jgi:hypothetical protein
MASKSISFPDGFSFSPEETQIIQNKWNELTAWKESNSIPEEEFDLTFSEFADEIRISVLAEREEIAEKQNKLLQSPAFVN